MRESDRRRGHGTQPYLFVKKEKKRGFTLVELAVVVTIIGLLVIGAIGLTRPIVDNLEVKGTKANMAKIVQALAAYARANNRLPCPADPDLGNVVYLLSGPVYAGFTHSFDGLYKSHDYLAAQRSNGLLILAGGGGGGGGGGGTPPTTASGQAFGAEIGSEGTALGFGDCRGGDPDHLEGIVPYFTLGLNPDIVRDAWGRFITYRVSPAFAANPEILQGSGGAGIPGPYLERRHERCRTPLWYDSDGVHKNPDKAFFCCPVADPAGEYGISYDIHIENKAGDLLHATRPNGGAGAGTPYKSYTTKETNTGTMNNVTVPAFVLVSHGRNGHGAFRDDGSRIVLTGDARGDDEEENANGLNNPVNRARLFIQDEWDLTPGSDYYDDIVLWMTQDQLYAALGDGESCAYP